MVDSKERELEAGGNSKFVEGIREVVFDGLFADGKLLRYVAIAVSGHDGGNNLKFPGSKAELGLARLCSCRGHEVAQGLNKIGDAFAPHPELSPYDGLDALEKQFCGYSFRTTPRAPSCNASTIWVRSIAAVSRIVRTGVFASASSRSASKPGFRGMATSRSRMSGFNWRASFTASSPFGASPTTCKPSACSKRRRPSRKMG